MFSCYWIRNIRQLFLLVHEIYFLNNYSRNIYIRSTTHRRAISCHLFECHVLLIRNTTFQSDIPVTKFFILPLYQEHNSSEGDFVPPPQVFMFSWYRIRNIGHLFLLLHEIYLLKYYSKNICIRITTDRRAISCHLLECRVLLIPNTKYRTAIPCRSRDIPLKELLEEHLYQEYHPPESDLVPLRVSCFPDTKYEISIWYSCDKIFWSSSVSGARAIGGRLRATFSSVIFSWYRIRNIGQLFLLFHWIYLLKYYSKNMCIRSTTHRRAFSCHLFECHILLIRNTKYRPATPSRSRDIPL